MKKLVMAGLVIACSVVIIVSFFAPWAKAKVSVTKTARGLAADATTKLKGIPFTEEFINKLNETADIIGSVGDIEVKAEVSGYDIPTLINKKSSKIAISLAQVLFKDVQNLDKKSYLVYLLPLFALICCIAAILGLKNKIAVIVMIAISGIISIGGLYNLYTINLAGLPIEIAICNGLWHTMYGYLSIFILGIIWLVTERK